MRVLFTMEQIGSIPPSSHPHRLKMKLRALILPTAIAVLIFMAIPALDAKPSRRGTRGKKTSRQVSPAPAGKSPYASSAPITQPEIFGEDVISGGDYDSHPAFTPDGKTLYFVRSAPNFNFWTIVVSRFQGTKWSTPTVAPFSGQYCDADPFITHDGKHFYFISTRPVTGEPKGDTDIWVMDQTDTGWSEPRHLEEPVNSAGSEWFPSLTRDGTIYFGSDRTGGKGKTDLYRAPMANGKYTSVENLNEPLSTAADEYEPLIAPDESFLIFMASGRSDSLGESDLYVSYRRRGVWSAPQNFGKNINSKRIEYSPMISPDGKYFFWTSTRNFTDAPLPKRLGTAAMMEKLHSARNGLGDIYRIDLSQLHLKNDEPRMPNDQGMRKAVLDKSPVIRH